MSRGIGVLVVFAVLVNGVEPAAAKPARPDLVVTKAPAVPAAVQPGTRLTVKDAVKNRGRRKAKRSVTRYYLSLDRKRNKGDRRLAGKRVVKGLRPRKRSRGRARLRVPAGLALGRYRLVACADDKKRVKEVRERNNCRASRRVEVTGTGVGRPAPGLDPAPTPNPQPGEPTVEPTPADLDGDGTLNSEDCAPNDPATHPGATDTPGGDYSDTDCDGIDGTASEAIFAATYGSDTDPGTRAKPKRSINAAIAAARETDRAHVYVGFGTYDETLNVANGISVYGGYGLDWTRSGADVTRLAGELNPSFSTTGARAEFVQSPTTLQQLTLAPRPPAAPGASSYGLIANLSPGLVLDGVVASGAPGQPGRPGEDGVAGETGKPGQSCPADPAWTPKLAGGSSPVNRPGGRGGRGGGDGVYNNGWENADGEPGGQGGGPQGGAGGSGGAAGDSGKTGLPGQVGASGTAGTDGLGGGGGGWGPSGDWTTQRGSAGTKGGDGNGGGGGGGGGQSQDYRNADGQPGGGGGGGSEGGGRGTGGQGGGGSFGVFVTFSNGMKIRNSMLEGASGGAGGSGGTGAAGGNWTLGGLGCPSGDGINGWEAGGGNGGPGGAGGHGGDGGGGAGGPSVALYTQGSAVTTDNNTLSFATGGSGGVGGDRRSGAQRGWAGFAGATNPAA